MKVLMLSWEFPPLMTGGLGMACYGMVKALLSMGIDIDLIIPSKEDIYFPLRKPGDADSMPAASTDPNWEKPEKEMEIKHMSEETNYAGSTYSTTGKKTFQEIIQNQPLTDIKGAKSMNSLLDTLSMEGNAFWEVKKYTRKAFDIAKKLDYDIIHSHDWMTFPAASLIKEFSGKPWIAHIHSTEFDRAGGPGDERIHKIEYIGTQLADELITVSGYTANILIERYKADKNKIKVIHNAFVVEAAGRPKERIFKEPTVTFMGRITLQKGPDYFLEIARKVLKKEKNIRFIMAGRGDMEREITHQAASMGLGTKFLFSGFLNRQEVESVLSASDIFVMPSISEPFGIVPLEAMSYGAVAIISKKSGVAEIVKNAYKVDFWDIDKIVSIILELVKDPGKLKKLSEKSRCEASKIQWRESAQKIIDIYRGKIPCLT